MDETGHSRHHIAWRQRESTGRREVGDGRKLKAAGESASKVARENGDKVQGAGVNLALLDGDGVGDDSTGKGKSESSGDLHFGGWK